MVLYNPNRNSHLKSIKKTSVFDVINVTFMLCFAFMTLFPLYYVLVGSFNDGIDYTAGGVYFFPRQFTLNNYMVVLNDTRIWKGYLITIGRTLIGTLSSLIFTSMVAFAMSRKRLRGRKFFYWINIFTMFFGGGIVPYFLVLKLTGLINTFWVYIIPALYSVYNMIVFQNFFNQIPEEIHEAALVDGASEFKIYYQIFIPLSKPIIATIALWTIVGHWNSYLDSMYYVTNPDLYSLQYVLMRIIKESSVPSGGIVPLPPSVTETVTAKTISLAAIIVSTLPVLAVYPFLQKHFANGVMVGSLKG